jgi:hypothetical protein
VIYASSALKFEQVEDHCAHEKLDNSFNKSPGGEACSAPPMKEVAGSLLDFPTGSTSSLGRAERCLGIVS